MADVRELLGLTDAEVLFSLLDLVADRDAGGCLVLLGEQVDAGADLGTLTNDLLAHLRTLFLCQQLEQLPADVAVTEDERARLSAQAARLPAATVHRLVDLLRDVLDQVREGADPRLPLELALVRICRPAGDLSLEALEQRVTRLESGAAPTAAPAPRPNGNGAPAAQAPTPAPPPPGDASPERVREAWHDQIMPEIGRRSSPLAALLLHVAAVEVEDSGVVIRFPASKSFARAGTDTPPNRELISEVVAMAAGGPVPVRFATSDEPEPAAEPDPAEPLPEDELLSQLKETFDAREIEEPKR